jgi:hypothetical protein
VWRCWDMDSKGYADGSCDQAGHGDSGGHHIEFVCARTGLSMLVSIFFFA